jgi:hypothetical protein
MGVYRHQTIRDAGLTFLSGLHHQDIIWTTELCLMRSRALRKSLCINTCTAHRLPVAHENLAYQRHYIKITRLLDKMNHLRWAFRIQTAGDWRYAFVIASVKNRTENPPAHDCWYSCRVCSSVW